MASTFPDLDDFFDDSLKLPIKGKVYTVKPPSDKVGLYVQRLMEAGAKVASGELPDIDAPKLVLDDDEEKDLYTLICGAEVLAELEADGVSWPKRQLFANTVFIWVGMGEQAALAYWQASGDPKAGLLPGANRETRRATEFRRTDAASTSQNPDSMSGTTRPTTSSRRRRNRR